MHRPGVPCTHLTHKQTHTHSWRGWGGHALQPTILNSQTLNKILTLKKMHGSKIFFFCTVCFILKVQYRDSAFIWGGRRIYTKILAIAIAVE